MKTTYKIMALLIISLMMLSACNKKKKDEPNNIIQVTEVKLTPAAVTLEVGGKATLSLSVLPQNATDKSVTWESSAKNIATVVNGEVTAIAEGSATITATTKNGKKATCSVTVKAQVVEVTSITIEPNALELEVNEEKALTCTVLPENATDKKMTWSSSDNAIATVNEEGLVKAIAAGTATITATSSNGKTATCEVTVKPQVINVESITLTPATAELEVGKEMTLTCKVLPENTTDKSVTWSSSDEAVATVKDGVVKAFSAGTATITATSSNGKKATCEVTVKPQVINVESITLTPATAELEVGKEMTLTCKVLPENTTDKSVTWSSSDEAVATVKDGVVKAISAGKATITATSKNGIKGTCTITVKKAESDDNSIPDVPGENL